MWQPKAVGAFGAFQLTDVPWRCFGVKCFKWQLSSLPEMQLVCLGVPGRGTFAVLGAGVVHFDRYPQGQPISYLHERRQQQRAALEESWLPEPDAGAS